MFQSSNENVLALHSASINLYIFRCKGTNLFCCVSLLGESFSTDPSLSQTNLNSEKRLLFRQHGDSHHSSYSDWKKIILLLTQNILAKNTTYTKTINHFHTRNLQTCISFCLRLIRDTWNNKLLKYQPGNHNF